MTHVDEMSAEAAHVKWCCLLLRPVYLKLFPPRVAANAALSRLSRSSQVVFRDRVILDVFVPFPPCKKKQKKPKAAAHAALRRLFRRIVAGFHRLSRSSFNLLLSE